MVASLFGLLLLLFVGLFVSHELKQLNTFCAYHTNSNNVSSILCVFFAEAKKQKRTGDTCRLLIDC